MSNFPLTPDLLGLVATRFKALGEPARLGILNALRAGETSVSGVMAATGLGQANVSRHLHLLYTLGFVERRREGLFVYYRLANDDVFQLCDVMCARLAEEAALRTELLER